MERHKDRGNTESGQAGDKDSFSVLPCFHTHGVGDGKEVEEGGK